MKKIYSLVLLFAAGMLSAQVPTASFAVSQTSVCPNTVIQTTNLTTGGATSYTFVVDGTTSLTANNPTISFANDGSHAIDLYAENASGVSAPFSIGITVYPAPVVSTGTAGTTALSPPNGSTNGWSPMVWNFTDPLPAGAVLSGITLTFSGVDQGWGGTGAGANFYLAGKYFGTAILTHSSVNYTISLMAPFPGYVYSGSNTLEMYFVGWSGWQAFFNSGAITLHYQTNAAPIYVCAGTPVSLNAIGATSYSWNPVATNNTTFVPLSTAIYTVTGVSAFGCTNTATQLVSVSEPTITASGGAICPGQNYVIQPSGAASYTISGNQYTVSPNTTSSYSITGTGTDGCLSLSPAIVTVSVIPLPNISVNSGSACIGSNFTLQPSGASSYSFQNGSAILTVTASGNYTVMGYNQLGCAALSPAIASVVAVALPQTSLQAGMICNGATYSLQASGAVSYTYSSGSPVISPVATANYTVIGANAEGCTSMAVASVIVEKCTGVEQFNGSVNQLLVYPNPGQGLLTVQAQTACELQIIDMQGKILGHLKIVEGSQQVQLDLEAGLYYLRNQSTAESIRLQILR